MFVSRLVGRGIGEARNTHVNEQIWFDHPQLRPQLSKRVNSFLPFGP